MIAQIRQADVRCAPSSLDARSPQKFDRETVEDRHLSHLFVVALTQITNMVWAGILGAASQAVRGVGCLAGFARIT
jgi:hypothetical protein